MSIQATHWDDCWKSGPEHYECARAEVEDAHKAQRQAENDLSKYMARCAIAEPESAWLRAELERMCEYAQERALLHSQSLEAAEAEVERLRLQLAAAQSQINGFYLGSPDTRLRDMTHERDALRAEVERLREAARGEL